MSGKTASASGGPSTRITSGFNAWSALRTLRAEPGPWWRMPKMDVVDAVAVGMSSGSPGSRDLPTGPVQVLPALALLDDSFHVFEPDDAVLNRVLDDDADEARGEVVGAHPAVAEVGGERQAVA